MSAAAELPLATVDLGAFLAGNAQDRRRIAGEVDEICRSTGFLVIANNGVPRRTCRDAWTAARAFFDLPLEAKMASRPAEPGCPRGYFPVESESLGKTRGVDAQPDLKESFSSGPPAPPVGHASGPSFDFFYGPNTWPAEPAGFRDAWLAYYEAMERLGASIMRLLAAALQLEEDYFERFHTHHLGALRALNYPATDTAGQPRAGAHTDYGSVTILKPDSDVGGLELRLPSGEWSQAQIVDDSFIVNIGDLMARWTNDRWVSTLHRVTGGDDDGSSPRRQSIAFFLNPNYDAEIRAIPSCIGPGETPLYPPTLAGEYLLRQFHSAI